MHKTSHTEEEGMHNWRWVRLLVFVSALWAGFTAFYSLASAAADPEPAGRIQFQKALLSIEAKDVSWAGLLADVSLKTGIIFHTKISVAGLVNVRFNDLPIERAMENLFGRDANMMFVYGNQRPNGSVSDVPSEIWIFGSGPLTTIRSFVPQGADEHSVETVAEHAEDPAEEIANQVAKDFNRNPESARAAARSHPDPIIRLRAIGYLGEQAIGYLGHAPDEQAMNVLLDLVQDRDPHMRQSAVDALGPLVENNPRVRTIMTHVMNTTADPEIRQMVADSLGVQLDAARSDL
jgi:hypothetical protein